MIIDHQNQYRKDETSGAFINMSYSQYHNILTERERIKADIEKSIELDKLRTEMEEIKSLLATMVKRNN